MNLAANMVRHGLGAAVMYALKARALAEDLFSLPFEGSPGQFPYLVWQSVDLLYRYQPTFAEDLLAYFAEISL